MARWQSCTVLQVGKEGRQVWQFSAAGGGKVNLQRHESRLPNEPLPAKIISKDWQTLFQPKLNIAWLPADQVFLRVLQLPKTDAAEMQSMVEFQLEKVSPLPVAQIVWSFEVLPQPAGETNTVVVIIAARSLVEEFLGRIEGQGYLADRLELPSLDQLHLTQFDGQGVWIYPGAGVEKDHCLMAWYYGGVLCNLSLVRLPAPEARGAMLREHIAQVTWAGELEGWLTAPPAVHVVAEVAADDAWLATFVQEQAAQVVAPASPDQLATHTARRLAVNGATTNLMPPEYGTRYRQNFIDRLWMRGLVAVLALYLLGIAAYFGYTSVERWRWENVQGEIFQISNTYTNALRMKEHVRVLRDQIDLQYAALDCYKAVADHLPLDLTLNSINFERGRKLTVTGAAASDALAKVQSFNEALRDLQVNNQPLFSKVNAPVVNPAPGQNQSSWVFPCELKRTDAE